MSNENKKFIEQAAPEYWYSYAEELAETADGIYKRSKNQWIGYVYQNADGSEHTERRPFVSRPVLLFYGIAIENLIKGLMISEDPNLLKDVKLNKHLLGHDLSKLAGKLKTIQLTSGERELFSLLSDVVPYHGRYPVPRNARDLKPEKYINEKIYNACVNLFERLSIQLYRLNYMGIDAPDGVKFACLRLQHLDDKVDFDTSASEEVSWRDFQKKFLE